MHTFYLHIFTILPINVAALPRRCRHKLSYAAVGCCSPATAENAPTSVQRPPGLELRSPQRTAATVTHQCLETQRWIKLGKIIRHLEGSSLRRITINPTARQQLRHDATGAGLACAGQLLAGGAQRWCWCWCWCWCWRRCRCRCRCCYTGPVAPATTHPNRPAARRRRIHRAPQPQQAPDPQLVVLRLQSRAQPRLRPPAAVLHHPLQLQHRQPQLLAAHARKPLPQPRRRPARSCAIAAAAPRASAQGREARVARQVPSQEALVARPLRALALLDLHPVPDRHGAVRARTR